MTKMKYRDPATQPLWSMQVFPGRMVRFFLAVALMVGLAPPILAGLFAVSYPIVQYDHPAVDAATNGAFPSLAILALIYLVVSLAFLVIAAGVSPLKFKRLDAFPLIPMVSAFVYLCYCGLIAILFVALIPLNAFFGLPPGVLPPAGMAGKAWAYSFWGFFYLNGCVALAFMMGCPFVLWLSNQTDAEYFTKPTRNFIVAAAIFVGLLLSWLVIATAMTVRVM